MLFVPSQLNRHHNTPAAVFKKGGREWRAGLIETSFQMAFHPAGRELARWNKTICYFIRCVDFLAFFLFLDLVVTAQTQVISGYSMRDWMLPCDPPPAVHIHICLPMRRLLVMIDLVGNVQSFFFFDLELHTTRGVSQHGASPYRSPSSVHHGLCLLRPGSARPEHQPFSVNSQSAYQSWETRVNIVFDSICFWQCKANGKLPPGRQPNAIQRLQVGASAAAVHFSLRLNVCLKFKVTL